MPRSLSDPYTRFDALAGEELATGCRTWFGHHNVQAGYPMLMVKNEETGKWAPVGAHRLALQRKLGRCIRPGFEAAHRCNNRWCIAEAHLVDEPKAENIREANFRRWANWREAAAQKRDLQHIRAIVRGAAA